MDFAQMRKLTSAKDPMVKSVSLSPLELNAQNSLRRESPRPEHLRGANYDKRFDGLTVFYDCFRTIDGGGTIMLGPPLFNLERVVWRALRRALGIPWLTRIPIWRFDRHSQLRMGPIGNVKLRSRVFGQERLIVQDNCSDLFRGRRVVFTLTQNNDLQWIKDWVRFFSKKHGADAILLYDNASTKYTSNEIRETINSVPGVDVGLVVDWPYPYGIQDGIAWDSDYCQYGMLEHAHHRFLRQAQAVVNSDIDELPITEQGESLFDIALRSSTGYLHYGGSWVENASPFEGEGRRHKHFIYRTKNSPAMSRKWTVIPTRCSSEAQWRVHDVFNLEPDPLSSHVLFRHFKAINTGWLEGRWRPETPHEQEHVVDDELSEWLQMFDVE